MRSQNNEEQIILQYFGSQSWGNVLDIGANDGVTLSNSHEIIRQGWGGVLVEPSPTAFSKLINTYKDNNDVICFPFAISNASGEVDFYSSGTHLGNGDTDLLSTLDPKEMKRWEGTQNVFTKTKVKSITFKELMGVPMIKTFDLITIDAEGCDYDILVQMNLEELNCKMLIIETNGIEDQKYIDYCSIYGMKLFHKNYENLIFTK